jgi:hypothetical protein
MQQFDYNNGRVVFSMWPVLSSYNQEVWSLVSSVESSAGEAVKTGPEHVKLKNLHCE